MRRTRIPCLLLLLATAISVRGDERVREVQEELRQRNLYFGDVNGQSSPELANALKRYQTRKGFEASGRIDEATATSLGLEPHRPIAAETRPALPDVPILKSDLARKLPNEEKIALQKEADAHPDGVPSPPPPAEAPSPAGITPQRIEDYVQQYLRDGESDDIAAQVNYFTYPVEYFDHGRVGAPFVQRDVVNYVKRWPERKYQLLQPPKVSAGPEQNEVRVEFPIHFEVHNDNHVAKGRTNNYWTLRQEGDDLKIVAIREQRVRE